MLKCEFLLLLFLQIVFHLCPRFHDRPLVHTEPFVRFTVLKGVWGLKPVGAASVSRGLLECLSFLEYPCFIIDLMHIRGRKVQQRLMRAVMIVVVNILPNLLVGGAFIRIIADDIYFFLFQTAVKPFRDGIVGGPAYPPLCQDSCRVCYVRK